MKLASRVKRMADGYERQASRLNAYLVSDDANNTGQARLKFMVMSDVYATLAASLRTLESADTQVILRNLARMTDDMRHDIDDCATLAEAAVGAKDEGERIIQDAKGREYARVLQQLETLKTLDRDDK